MTESLWLSLPAFGTFVQILGLTLLHSLWQCAAIGLIAWLALHALRNATPQARYAVACAALAACILWPTAQLAQALFAPHPTPHVAALPILGNDGAQAAMSNGLLPIGAVPLDRMLPWIVTLWAVGASAMLLRLLAGLRWVARLRRSAATSHSPIWQRRLDRLARRSGLSNIRLAVLDGDGSSINGPLAAGIWRPMVLVPVSLLARMPVEMLDALLAHELAHIRRHDYLVNLFQRIAEALLFYHPVAWWLSHRIRLEREFVADALAVEVIGEPRQLARALAELDRLTPNVPSLAQAAHGGHLMSRIQSLIRPQPRASAGIVLLPAVGLALACIGFLAFAQSAQTRAPAVVTPKVTVGALSAASAAASASRSESADTYALVDSDSDRLSMSGSTDEIDAIRAAQSHIDGDFLWFRRSGKAYVLRDPATLELVRTTWATGDQRNDEMEVLTAQMQARADEIEAISRRIDTTAAAHQQTPAMRSALDALHRLAERQGALAQQQATLATAMVADPSDEKAMAEAEDRIDALDAQMEKLDVEMESLEGTIEIESAKLEADLAPLAAMQDQIEAATVPLEALSAKMEALGTEQERDMAKIDQKVRSIVDEAFAKGLASPADDQRR
jgi:beta-lactamase regulating signal transducer with metallopeptidase domain